VLKSDIKPNTEYALREKRGPGEPFQRVRVIEHIRKNKWRVEWLEPHPGLVDYVESGQLICPWKEHKAFLKEEGNAKSISEYNERHGYDNDDSPLPNAVLQVFESTGDNVGFYRGCLSGSQEAIRRVRSRAGTVVEQEPWPAYIDRKGDLHLPFDAALDVAKKLCSVEPQTVLVGVETTEREWSHKASRGEDYIVTLLNQYRASWAIIRQWAGHDAAIAQREEEIKRLERLVWDAIYILQKAGLDSEAAKLRRSIEKGYPNTDRSTSS
jgi:hypothetical protein